MFNFKLQSILDVRKILEEKVLLEFSEQQKELHREEGRLNSVLQEKTALTNALRSIKGTTVNVSEITMNIASIKRCQHHEALQRELIKEVTKKVDKKKEALFEAMTKRKAMEILKTKVYEQHQSDADQLERTVNDEMVIMRHNRRKEK